MNINQDKIVKAILIQFGGPGSGPHPSDQGGKNRRDRNGRPISSGDKVQINNPGHEDHGKIGHIVSAGKNENGEDEYKVRIPGQGNRSVQKGSNLQKQIKGTPPTPPPPNMNHYMNIIQDKIVEAILIKLGGPGSGPHPSDQGGKNRRDRNGRPISSGDKVQINNPGHEDHGKIGHIVSAGKNENGEDEYKVRIPGQGNRSVQKGSNLQKQIKGTPPTPPPPNMNH